LAFEGTIGNEENKKMLISSVKNKNILHSYLFYGTEGIGKKIFAMEFAKMILCNNESGQIPCNKCKSCDSFDSNNNPDFFIIEPDGNSIKIDQIRAMQKSVIEKPIESNKKVFIIDNADTMTKEAQNCMLKTLEEPQEYIVIILIASNENNILATVKSRCTKVFFKPLDEIELKKYMSENYEDVAFDSSSVSLCNGSIAKAQKIISKSEVLDSVKQIVNDVRYINKLEFFKKNEIFYDNKDDIDLLLEYMYISLFEITKAEKYNINGYLNAMKIVEQTKQKIRNSNNYDMSIDSMLINIWEEVNEKNNRG